MAVVSITVILNYALVTDLAELLKGSGDQHRGLPTLPWPSVMSLHLERGKKPLRQPLTSASEVSLRITG